MCLSLGGHFKPICEFDHTALGWGHSDTLPPARCCSRGQNAAYVPPLRFRRSATLRHADHGLPLIFSPPETGAVPQLLYAPVQACLAGCGNETRQAGVPVGGSLRPGYSTVMGAARKLRISLGWTGLARTASPLPSGVTSNNAAAAAGFPEIKRTLQSGCRAIM